MTLLTIDMELNSQNTHPNNAHVFFYVQFALALERIQIPEVSLVWRWRQRVASRRVDWDVIDGRFVATHACHLLFALCQRWTQRQYVLISWLIFGRADVSTHSVLIQNFVTRVALLTKLIKHANPFVLLIQNQKLQSKASSSLYKNKLKSRYW